jgi:hypothetical protein
MKALALALLLCLVSGLPAQDQPKVDRDHSHPPALPLKKDYPPLRSFIGSCGKKGCEGMELVTSVKKAGDKWEYTYVLKNVGKRKTWLVGSSIPDRAIGLSSDSRDIAHYYRLKPGKSLTVKVVHKDPPSEYMGIIRCFNKDRHDGIKEWYKTNGVTITGVQPTYFFQMSGGANGWLPKGLLPRKEK